MKSRSRCILLFYYFMSAVYVSSRAHASFPNVSDIQNTPLKFLVWVLSLSPKITQSPISISIKLSLALVFSVYHSRLSLCERWSCGLPTQDAWMLFNFWTTRDIHMCRRWHTFSAASPRHTGTLEILVSCMLYNSTCIVSWLNINRRSPLELSLAILGRTPLISVYLSTNWCLFLGALSLAKCKVFRDHASHLAYSDVTTF